MKSQFEEKPCHAAGVRFSDFVGLVITAAIKMAELTVVVERWWSISQVTAFKGLRENQAAVRRNWHAGLRFLLPAFFQRRFANAPRIKKAAINLEISKAVLQTVV
jgi:hypothetical protein